MWLLQFDKAVNCSVDWWVASVTRAIFLHLRLFSLRTQTYFRLSVVSAENTMEPVTAGNTSAFAGYVSFRLQNSRIFCEASDSPYSNERFGASVKTARESEDHAYDASRLPKTSENDGFAVYNKLGNRTTSNSHKLLDNRTRISELLVFCKTGT